MAQNSGNLRERHSLLDHPCACRVTETVEGQSINAAMLDSSSFTGRSETSLDVRRDSKDARGVRQRGSLEFFEFNKQRLSDRDVSLGRGFRVRRSNPNLLSRQVDVWPREFQNLPKTHPRRKRTHQNRSQMFGTAGAKQPRFFVVGKRSFPSPLVSHADKGVMLLEWALEQPAFLLRLAQHRSDSHEFTVHAGNGSVALGNNLLVLVVRILSLGDDRLSQAVLFVLLQLAVSNRTQFVATEVFDDRFQLILLAPPRLLTFNQPAVAMLRRNQVAVRIPVRQLGKSFLSVSDGAVVAFQAVQFLLEILFRLGAVLSGSPYRMAFAIKANVGGPGVNLSTLFDYLELTFARHVYTSIAISFGFSDRGIAEGIADATPESANIKGFGLFYFALNFSQLFPTVTVVVIVDQEVVDSNSTSRPKFLSKRESIANSSGRLSFCLHLFLHTRRLHGR